jgi:hypothetical protein
LVNGQQVMLVLFPLEAMILTYFPTVMQGPKTSMFQGYMKVAPLPTLLK